MWNFGDKHGQTEDDNRRLELIWLVALVFILLICYLVINNDPGIEALWESQGSEIY